MNPMEGTAFISKPSELQRIETNTSKLGFTMASDPRTGSILQVLAASKPSGRMLEAQAPAPASLAAWLLSGMDEKSTLVSVDTSSDFQAVAREILGQDHRLTLVLEDGASFLRKQQKHSFDLVFADAMPGKYESLDEALALVAPGGFYIIDDMLPQANWPEGHDQKALTLMYRQLSS